MDAGSNYNTFIGRNVAAATLNDATHNIAIGDSAMNDITTADNNVGIGSSAMLNMTTATQNVAIGRQAMGLGITTGGSNVFIGHYTAMVGPTTGSNNTYVGSNAGYQATGSNNVLLGQGANPSTTSESNEIVLGNTSNDNLRCNDTSISSLSDRRDKTDIVDLPTGLNFLNTLRPVKFKWATRDGNVKDGKTRAGFIAQAVSYTHLTLPTKA